MNKDNDAFDCGLFIKPYSEHEWDCARVRQTLPKGLMSLP